MNAWNGYEDTRWAGHPDRYDAVNSGFDDSCSRTSPASTCRARCSKARRLAAAEGIDIIAFERGDAQVPPGDLTPVFAAMAAHLPPDPPSPDGTSPLSLAVGRREERRPGVDGSGSIPAGFVQPPVGQL